MCSCMGSVSVLLCRCLCLGCIGWQSSMLLLDTLNQTLALNLTLTQILNSLAVC